ncbi:hypothetical protein Tco_1450791, partial [Tanacetum coccineum]
MLGERRVFPSSLDGEHITGNMVFRIIEDELFDRLHDDDAVILCCLGILQLVLLGVEGKRRIPDWMLMLANDRVGWDNYPWDETEARSDWWISSRAYSDGGIDQAERVPRHLKRQNMYEVLSELYRQFEEQKRDLEKQKRDIKEIRKKEADHQETQHYGISDLSEFSSMQGGPSSFQTHPNSSSFFNIGTPTNWQTPMSSQLGSSNWQTPMPTQPGLSNWQRQMPAHSATPYWQPTISSHSGTYNWQSLIPSHMGNPNLQPPIRRHHDATGLFDQWSLFMEQPPSTVLPKQRGNKTKKNVKKFNLSPLNLGNALDDDNERGGDVMFLGGQFIGNYLVYENVDISK